jgi:hypothetical protein
MYVYQINIPIFKLKNTKFLPSLLSFRVGKYVRNNKSKTHPNLDPFFNKFNIPPGNIKACSSVQEVALYEALGLN